MCSLMFVVPVLNKRQPRERRQQHEAEDAQTVFFVSVNSVAALLSVGVEAGGTAVVQLVHRLGHARRGRRTVSASCAPLVVHVSLLVNWAQPFFSHVLALAFHSHRDAALHVVASVMSEHVLRTHERVLAVAIASHTQLGSAEHSIAVS
eukprot:PhM_4_TR3402/c3_g1_i6/m.83228